jgi:hypothetical protein
MSASWIRFLDLMIVSIWLATGCAKGMNPEGKVDVGGSCVLNSDCNQGLVCTWDKCHDACHTSVDCPTGQSCVVAADQSTVCQLTIETHCLYASDCPTPLICAVDQQCRNQCQGNVDCTPGQTCTTTNTCAEPKQVDSNNNLIGTVSGAGGSGGALGSGGTGGSSGHDAAIPDGPAQVLVMVNSSALDFGSVDVGQTSTTPRSVTVTNLGPATSLTPTILQPSPFSLAGSTCTTLPASGTCTISVSFTPDHTGPAAGTLVVAGSVMVSLTGVGSPPTDFTQTDHIDLGTILVGATVFGKVTVTATNPLTDLLCSVSSAGSIKADPTTTTCPTAAPGALAKSASCFFGFTFSSATAGAKTGDEVICNAGSVTKITSITAVVVSGAKLAIAPAAPQVAATTGKSNTVTVMVANGGGSPTGAITAAITPANPEFVVSGTTCAVGLLPLGTCSVIVTFQPVTDGTKTAVLAVTDAGAPAGTLPTTVAITGVATGPSNLTITGGPDLGAVALGEVGTPVTFTVRNTGGTDAMGVFVTSNNSAFVLGNDGCTGQTLAKTTGTCTLTLTFAPSATGLPGAYSGLLTASSEGGNLFNLPITATATKPAILTITPNPLVFGTIAVNTQSADEKLTITNAGGASTGALTVPSALGNGFVISGNTCSPSLVPTQSCTMSIRFIPAVTNQATWTFTVTSTSGAFATGALIGTGV